MKDFVMIQSKEYLDVGENQRVFVFTNTKGYEEQIQVMLENSIKLDGSGISLISNGDINIESSKKISIKSDMDVEIEGMNIKNTAKAKFSADGSAGSELTTSAIAIVKGSMVKIN